MALHQYQKQQYQKIGVIVALIALPIAGFVAGMQYQKQTGQSTTMAQGQFGENGARMFRGGAFGTVKAVSDTSITVTERRDSSDKTYTITSDTTYKNGTEAATAADVKVGNSVMLTLDTNDTSKVTAVTLNPAMGGPQMQTSDGTSGNTTLQ